MSVKHVKDFPMQCMNAFTQRVSILDVTIDYLNIHLEFVNSRFVVLKEVEKGIDSLAVILACVIYLWLHGAGIDNEQCLRGTLQI